MQKIIKVILLILNFEILHFLEYKTMFCYKTWLYPKKVGIIRGLIYKARYFGKN